MNNAFATADAARQQRTLPLQRSLMLRRSLLVLAVVAGSAAELNSRQAHAEMPPGYSHLGLGVRLIDYEENITRVIGGRTVDVETDTVTVPAQHSGAWVAVNEQWGFHLDSSTTLGNARVDEAWEIDGAVVRERQLTLSQQRLDLIAARHWRAGIRGLAGLRYAATRFDRFGGRLTDAAAQVGLTATDITDGNVSENAWSLGLLVGAEGGNVFIDPQSGWRYQWQAMAGLPLITRVSNTAVDDGRTYSNSLDGYQLLARVAYGYQVGAHGWFALSVEASLEQRGRIGSVTNGSDDASADTDSVVLPDNRLIHVQPTLVASWSF